MVNENGHIPSYTPEAYYGRTSDSLEYVKVDKSVYYERVDEFLTLVRDMDTRKTVGFKLKGFYNMFRGLIEDSIITDAEFILLVRVFEKVLTKRGTKLTTALKAHYDEAYQMAGNDNVRISVRSLAA